MPVASLRSLLSRREVLIFSACRGDFLAVPVGCSRVSRDAFAAGGDFSVALRDGAASSFTISLPAQASRILAPVF